MGQKHFFKKNLKEATNDYFFICFRQELVSIEWIQTSIIHIPPC